MVFSALRESLEHRNKELEGVKYEPSVRDDSHYHRTFPYGL